MKQGLWMYFNSDLFLVTNEIFIGNSYLFDTVESEVLQLNDILFVSEYLGEL